MKNNLDLDAKLGSFDENKKVYSESDEVIQNKIAKIAKLDVSRAIDLDTFDVNDELPLFEDCAVKPIAIIVRLFVSAEKTKSNIIIPKSVRDTEEIYNNVGYVAKIGTECFKDNFASWKDWYKLGDWVVIPRHEGLKITFKGLPIFVMHDDCPVMRIKSPSDVLNTY